MTSSTITRIPIAAIAALLQLAAPCIAAEEATIVQLSAAQTENRQSAVELTKWYLERIRTIDAGEGATHSVLAINPDAIEQARALDRERATRGPRGPLHGIPILLKDNIETRDPLPTTAGSLALAANRTGRDAPIVARLRAAGAIVLGKTNLSEWANIRSPKSTSGWSAVGGLTRNPYGLDRSACGSSSGSGVAVSANLAAAAIGTETDGSVTCPAAMNGLVGLKPTIGLLSRRHIVPISHTQDTAGPMTRTVADAAALLTVMAGSDPEDLATTEADARRVDYVAALDAESLADTRLGVMWFETGYCSDAHLAIFEQALESLRDAGAELIDLRDAMPAEQLGTAELAVLLYELKVNLDAYLADAAPAVTTRTLADVIAFNKANASSEMRWFGQEFFVQAQATRGLDDPAYKEALQTARRLAGPEGIDRLLALHGLDAMIAPTTGPAWLIDLENGDAFGGSATSLPAVAGYPHLTVPMGHVEGLPVGLSFIGPAWSDATLLSLGHAFESKTRSRRAPGFGSLLGVQGPRVDEGQQVIDVDDAVGVDVGR